MTNKLLLVAAAAAISALVSLPADAAGRPKASPAAPGTYAVQPPAGLVIHQSVGTISRYGMSVSISLPAATYTLTDPVSKFTCAANGGCTILISTMGTINSATDPNNWAMCTMVDDLLVNDTCLYQGTDSNVNQYHVGNARANYTVAKGKHTIRTTVYSDNDATLFAYDYSYEITTP